MNSVLKIKHLLGQVISGLALMSCAEQVPRCATDRLTSAFAEVTITILVRMDIKAR